MLLAQLIIPLSEPNWNSISFSNRPANQVNFRQNSIEITVKQSAGILFHKLANPSKVAAFTVDLEIKGKPNFFDEVSSLKWEEDSAFRMGLVVPGSYRPNAMKRMFLPQWIKKLLTLVPEGAGLEKVYFFNLGAQQHLLNKERTYPQSELLHERIVQKMKLGRQSFNYQLPSPLETAALWISVDGDESKSTYKLLIHSIELRTSE